jgi:hypothetical protein
MKNTSPNSIAGSELTLAEAAHIVHLPSPGGWRTAMVLPQWTELTKKIERSVASTLPQLGVLPTPLLSVSVSSSFFDSMNRNQGLSCKERLVSFDGIALELYILILQTPEESMTLIFDMRDLTVQRSVFHWTSLVGIPIITRDGVKRSGFSYMTALEEINAAGPICVPPSATAANRIEAVRATVLHPAVQQTLPALQTFVYVSSPSNIAEVMDVIGGVTEPQILQALKARSAMPST